MSRIKTETVVGLFLILGLLSFAFLAVKLGGIADVQTGNKVIKARFLSSSGLKDGADVEIAGVVVGKVREIAFDPERFEAVVSMSIPQEIPVQEDAIASIRSTGIIGGKFVKISPGGSELLLGDGDMLLETESSVSLEELISKYIFDGSSQ